MKRIDERGDTLVEVVMALAILSLVLVSSYTLATGTFRLGRGAGERTQAVNYLQQQVEALRTYRNSVDWDVTFVSKMTGLTGNNGAFCMKPPAASETDKRWLPVASSDPACTVNNTKISITSPTVGQQQLYSFRLKADWKTGSQDNTVTLTTKLAKQDQ